METHKDMPAPTHAIGAMRVAVTGLSGLIRD
jgi:hypothetical protein